MVQVQQDPQLCAQCRGRCCQGHPGVWSDPQRFLDLFCAGRAPSAEALRTILQRHRLTLREVGGVLIPAPMETPKGCALLGPEGCTLDSTIRPCQCLALIPDLETLLDEQIHCRLPAEAGSGSARENWRPWQELLTQVQ